MEEDQLQKEQNQEQEKKWCIYKHTNKINGKSYIGQTSQNVNQRWENGEGYKNCAHFYRAIKKYGWDNFEHEIVYTNLTFERANQLEKELIGKYELTDPKKGYNILDGGDSHTIPPEVRIKISESLRGKYAGEKAYWYGRPRTQESKDKMSKTKSAMYKGANNPFYGHHHTKESRKKMSQHAPDRSGANNYFYGKDMSGKNNARSKPIAQYTFEGQFVKKWDSAGEASRGTGIPRTSISGCCIKRLKQAGGYFWSFYNEQPIKRMKNNQRRKIMTNREEMMANTVDLMLSDNYKDRFRAEYLQLLCRVEGLAKMLYDWEDGKLGFEPTCDHFMYVEQLKAMREYLHILAERAEEEDIDISMMNW